VGVTHHRVLWSPDFPLPAIVPGDPVTAGNDRPAGRADCLCIIYAGRGAVGPARAVLRRRGGQLYNDTMSGERFTNARVHEWLTPEIDAVVNTMHTTRVQLNSAALWWFCRHLSAEQRAEILGEYVKVQARGGDKALPGSEPSAAAVAETTAPRGRRRKGTEEA
jgi:hypothetical protein